MEILLYVLISWLSSSEKMVIKDPPAVVVRTASSLSELYGSPVYALYNYLDQTIYLAEDIDISTRFGKSILVHELVHHYQYETGRSDKVECLRQLETLAYRTQINYLKYVEYDYSSIPELDEFNILMRSQC